MNILELSTNRFKHVVTLRVLLDNLETTETVAVAMVVVVVRSNGGAGGNSGSDSNSNLLSVNKVYKFRYFSKSFFQVSNPSLFWKWMAHDLIPLLYFTNLEIQQYKVINAEQTSTMIGMIRLRQLRAKNGTLH